MSSQTGEMTAPGSRRSPPVLGFFREAIDGIHFQATMEPGPNRVPHGHFASPIGAFDDGMLLGCRHGLVLIFHSSRDQILVWDPVTALQRRITTPPGLEMHKTPIDGAVLRAAGDHFQVVLVGYKKKNRRADVCFYSSETGLWSNVVSTRVPRVAMDHQGMPAVLAGDSLCWLLSGGGSSRLILEADLGMQSLAVTPVPTDMFPKGQDLMVMRADGGGLGLLSLSDYTVQLWKRRTDCDGVASWELGRTIDLGRLLSLDSQKQSYIQMLGYAEENNVAFFRTVAGIFMVQLHSSQFSKLPENNNAVILYPLESVYAADSTAYPMSAQASEMTTPECRRSPPVLGFFREAIDGIHFHPTMDPPNRVPQGRFSSPIAAGDYSHLFGCRHGLVLIFHSSRDQILVWDPVTAIQRRITTPPGFEMHKNPIDGAVLRVAGDHFQVVLVGYKKKNQRADVSFYSSETDIWSNVVSARVPRGAMDHQGMPALLAGDSLYWLLSGDGSSRLILEADLGRQSLAVTPVPMDMFANGEDLMVMQAEGGGLGLLSLSNYTVQLWKRNTDCDGVASWELGRTIDLGRLLSLDSQKQSYIQMLGYAEENNVAFFRTIAGIFMVQLHTSQFSKLPENNNAVILYPLESVYAADSTASPVSAQASEMTTPECCRSPPVLGFFHEAIDGIHFHPTMDPPSRVPQGRFSSPIAAGDHSDLFGCRHGLVLIFDSSRDQILLWDPVTGVQRRAATPLGFDVHQTPLDGAVRRVAGDHFQVVLLGYKQEEKNPRVDSCFYSSETSVWSNIISTPVPRDSMDYQGMPAVLVGDSLYWLLSGDGSSRVILEADFGRQSLAVMPVPMDMFDKGQDLMVIRAEGGGLGVMSVSDYTVQLWKRSTDCDGVASWVLGKTIDLGRLFSLDPQKQSYIQMLGYAEENNVAFFRTIAGIFMVQLHSSQFSQLPENNNAVILYPLESVYAAGNRLSSNC